MRGRSGFTLIELIIGMSAMAGVLAAAYLCLNAGLTSQGLIEGRRDAAQNARVAFRLLAGDLATACRLSKESEFVGMDRSLGEVEADNLDFGAFNWQPQRPGEGDFCEVSYYVDRSPETGGLSLWRRRDPSRDPEPLDGGTKEEIATDILGFRLEYYDGYDWFNAWGEAAEDAPPEEDSLSTYSYSNLYGLPEAVRITLAFAESGGERTGVDNRPQEVPLVFQTVVRLNLARKYLSLSTGLDSGIGDVPGTEAVAPGGTEERGNR